MAKTKIEVLDAVVDGQTKGAQFEIESKSADYLASIGYVKKVKEAPSKRKSTKKKDDAPKKEKDTE